MRNVADLTDTWGASIRVDARPGTTNDDPELFVVTIQDERIAAVTLNHEQAAALRDALTDVLN
jgi:hypothetical protein